MIYAFYLIVGAFAGVSAGLLGVGGGLVIVPVLIFCFSAQGMTDQVLTHMAVGTSLATIVFTSISSIQAHHQRGAVDWPLFWRFCPALCIGVWLGTMLAADMSGASLQVIFAVYALLIAVQMGWQLMPGGHRPLPGNVGISTAGGVIGGASALFGIGGGSLTVPFLNWCQVPMQKAVATSAACGLPIAVVGAVGYLAQGWNHPQLPNQSIGYLYLPAFIGIVAVSAIFAKLGAKWAHDLPAKKLKQVFAGYLALIGVVMLVRNLVAA